jgi:hypothetical protein
VDIDTMGRILTVFISIGLTFVGTLVAGIEVSGNPAWLMLSMALVVPLLLLPRLSQRWRTVGANCVPIMQIRQEVRRERVRAPIFSYISPLGFVAVLAFCGMVLLGRLQR